MMQRSTVMVAAGIGLTLGLLWPRASVQARGVIYLVGESSGWARPSPVEPRAGAHAYAPPASADDGTMAHGVILAGGRLMTASGTAGMMQSAAPRATSCADCTYATVVPIIRAVSHVTNVDAALVAAVIDVESGFNRYAVSPVGARGLMQLMPSTAMRFGVSDVNDPVQNIAAGSLYLNRLLQEFSGNVRDALAAYNAGERNVRDYGGIPPFPETQAYVPRVLARYAAFKQRFGSVDDASVVAARAGALPMLLTEYR